MQPSEDMEEHNAKKLRRKLNNRESARRSRQKKADEINRLQALVTHKDAELEHCRKSVRELSLLVRTLVAKVNELGGSVNEPGIVEALCAATAETQPATDALIGEAQIPPERALAVNVLGNVTQPDQGS